MIYLISGEEPFLLEQQKNQILKEADPEMDRNDTVVLDASDSGFDIKNALYECDSMPFFHEIKSVIWKNPYFLKSRKKGDAETEDNKKSKKTKQEKPLIFYLENYLKNPNPSTNLILYCDGYKADSRKKEYMLLKKYHVQIFSGERLSEDAFRRLAFQVLQKNHLHLNKEAENELFQRTGDSLVQFYKAVDKMVLYGTDFTQKDIIGLIDENPELDIWKMCDAFVSGNCLAALEQAREMILHGYRYQNLIAMLAARLRTLYNFKKLDELGYGTRQIAEKTDKQNSYQVERGLQEIQGVSSRTLLKDLNALAELDQGIKKGTMEDKEGFEYFILESGGKHAVRS